MDGEKGRYISHLRTNTRTIQTGMPVTICTLRRNGERLPGKTLGLPSMLSTIFCFLFGLNPGTFISLGVIGFCGTEVAFSSCRTPVGNLDSLIIGQFRVCSGQKLSQSPTGWGRAWAARAPELRSRSCYHMRTGIQNFASFKDRARSCLLTRVYP